MSTKLNGHKQTATSYRVCLFEQEPNPLDAEEGEDTDTLTTTESDESQGRDDEPDVDPREGTRKLLDVTHIAVVGLSMDNNKMCGFTEWCCTH